MNQMDIYRNEAENSYSNFAGSSYFGMFDSDSSDFCGTQDTMIEPYDRTLTFIITNTSGALADAILFGGYENAPQPAGVTVTVVESSHEEVRRETESNPYYFAGMKVRVTNEIQFGNPFKIRRKYATGSLSQGIYQPENYISPTNFNAKIIDDPSFKILIDGRTSIVIPIFDGITMTITFTTSSRANVANLVKGKNPKQVSPYIRPTGNPAIDSVAQLTGGMQVQTLAPSRSVLRPAR